MTADEIYAAHLNEVEELGWAEVLAQWDRWELAGWEGNWQDIELPPGWEWEDTR